MDVLTTAVEFYAQGIATIPVKSRSKAAAIRWAEFQSRMPTPADLVRWFSSWQGNIAVLCGPVSGNLVILDFDDLSTGLQWLAEAGISTYSVLTARGVHFYFRMRQLPASIHHPGLDVKASGYCLAPPSVHPTGVLYRVACDAPIANIGIDALPGISPPILSSPRTNRYPPPQPALDAWDAAENTGPSLVATIKARVSVLDFLPDAQKTDASGRWWIARCPFHDDQSPSFWIDARRGLCSCYAGCNGGRPMDVVNLVAALQGVSNQAAINLLRGAL